MTTPAVIETAVDRLSGPEQQALLLRLTSKLQPPAPAAGLPDRDAWMRRLGDLRASLGRPDPQWTAERIIDDLRSE